MSKKLIKCKTCENEIAKSAKVCPHCGAKNKKGHPVLFGILAIVVIMIIASFAGGNDTEPSVYSVGEVAEAGDVAVTLLNVSESNGSSFNSPADGNVFVICEFEIANNSDAEINVSSALSFDAYCDDYACTFSLAALLEKGNKNQLDGTVAAGKKFTGVVGYEVSADWQELEVNFAPDVWSGKKLTFVAVNN